MAQLITDATVGLKLDGVITELHPELNKEQVQEIAHHVYHKMNMIPVSISKKLRCYNSCCTTTSIIIKC